jgi:hypothetical protein
MDTSLTPLKVTGGLPLTHEACLPRGARIPASQTLYQNRLSRFYGDYRGRTPLPTASQETGFASLSSRFFSEEIGRCQPAFPAYHRLLYIPLAFATWACGCITRGVGHNPPNQCHTWLAVILGCSPRRLIS